MKILLLSKFSEGLFVRPVNNSHVNTFVLHFRLVPVNVWVTQFSGPRLVIICEVVTTGLGQITRMFPSSVHCLFRRSWGIRRMSTNVPTFKFHTSIVKDFLRFLRKFSRVTYRKFFSKRGSFYIFIWLLSLVQNIGKNFLVTIDLVSTKRNYSFNRIVSSILYEWKGKYHQLLLNVP